MTKSIIEIIKCQERDNSRCYDLIAAVISLSTDRILKKAEMIVGDHSLQSYECARIQLWKLSDKEMNECIMIHRGDIIQFNSVCLRSKYANLAGRATTSRQNCQKKEHKLSQCICDLHHPPMQSISVRRFVKVGAVCGRHTIMQEHKSGDSSDTDWNIVDQVGRWFRETNVSNHVDDSNRLHAKRKLRELITPNLKSDVLVRVLQMDTDEKSPKQMHGSFCGSKVNTEYVQIIVNDGEGVETEDDSKLLYVLRSSTLLVKIRECYQRQETFLLREMLTQKITKNIKPDCTNDEMSHSIVLVPSNKTCLEIVPQIPRNKVKCARIRSSPSPVATPTSRSGHDGESDCIKLIAHLSSMRFVDLETSIYSESYMHEYSEFFYKCFGKQNFDDWLDHGIILTIHPQGPSSEEQLQVMARNDIVATLCGCSHPPHRTKLISEEQSMFLKRLMSLKVPLEWSLKRNHILNATHVESVSMPSLDF